MSYHAIIKLTLVAALLAGLETAVARQVTQAAQTPPATEQQAPASLEGTIVRAGSAPPAGVPRARVILSSPERGINVPTMQTVITDESGRFVLRDIPPGPYNLMATRDGYVRGTKPIVLAARDSVTNFVLEMTPTGAISGRARNRDGGAIGNASVQAQRYTYRGGRRVLTIVQRTLTNDLGEFRLYYLPPGRYIVSAIPDAGPSIVGGPANTTAMSVPAVPGTPLVGSPPEGGGEAFLGPFRRASTTELLAVGLLPSSLTGVAHLPTYFPGTTDASAATPIDLAPATDFRGADFVVSESRASRIRGRVVNDLTGEPASNASVILLSRSQAGEGLPRRQTGTVRSDGTFEFSAVPPGSYDLVAVAGSLPAGMSSGGSGYPGGASINPIPFRASPRDFSVDPAGMRLAARIPIEVAGTDIDNLIVTPRAGYTIRGRVLIEGTSLEESQRQLEGVVVQLMPDSGDFESAAMPAPVRPDGTFAIVGALPGTYQIWLMGAANMRMGVVYIKSAMLGGVDVIDPRFVIEREPAGELEIIVSNARGNVEVSVVDTKQSPAASVTVVFVPDAPLRRHYDLYQQGQTNNSGIARMPAIPAGDYTAYAFENIEPGSWWDPDVMQQYAGLGTPIRIEANGRHRLTLKSIPAR